jgi:histidinol phosphatase-like PHP family hydrolase
MRTSQLSSRAARIFKPCIVVLKSAEVDIHENGSLDYSNAVLKELDLTICSIHSRFALSRELYRLQR